MGRFIDRVTIGVAVFIICFVLSVTISKNSTLSLIVSLAISLLFLIPYTHINNNRKDKRLSARYFDTYMIVMGIDYQLKTIGALYDNADIFDNCLVLSSVIIMPIFKFGALSRDDVIKAHNLAKNLHLSRIYLISNNIDRQAITFSNYFTNYSFHFVRSIELFKMLKAKKLLPNMPNKKIKSKLPVSLLFHRIFNRRNAPRLIFTSFILLLLGFVTPLHTYYYVVSAITALLGLVCIFSSNSISSSSHLPTPNKKDLPTDVDKS